MNNQEIINQLSVIFTDVIDEGEVQLTMESTANDVDDWDSLNHVQILAAIEKHYGFRFTLMEIQSLKNVGDLVTIIQSKIK